MNIAYFIKPKSTVAFVLSTNTVRQVIEKMKFHSFSALPILTPDGKYVGTVTTGDLLWSSYDKDIPKIEKILVVDIIKKDRGKPVSIFAELDELFDTLTVQNFVPVVDDRGYFMGIVTRRDFLTYCRNNLK